MNLGDKTRMTDRSFLADNAVTGHPVQTKYEDKRP